jgi:hypothetical protein
MRKNRPAVRPSVDVVVPPPGASSPAETDEELAPLNIIRTESVLSRLPIHNLSKGSGSIRILRKDANGKIDLQWEISPSKNFGEPRGLAYKLDTLIVNRRIEEYGKPLPKLLRIGSLREIAEELGLGGNTNKVKEAFLQNASAFITAKLSYRTTDGGEKRLESGFSRYSVHFKGETLPNGRKADAVYISLNDPYREILNTVPQRPLDYDYLKALHPLPQRFYEIIGRVFYTTFKYGHPAKLMYSDYCTYSTQQRSFDWNFVRAQMHQMHRPHLQSGYLEKVEFESTTDAEGQPDWTMIYTPGPKARAEHIAFTTGWKPPRGIPAPKTPNAVAAGAARGNPPGEFRPRAAPPAAAKPAEIPAHLVAELTRRGVSETQARRLLANVSDGQAAVDVLEWGDHLVRQAKPGVLRNPPGFYIYLLKEKITPPDGFETSRKREARAEAARKENELNSWRLYIRVAYDEYLQKAIDEYIAVHYTGTQMEELIRAKVAERRQQRKMLPTDTLIQIAYRDIRAEIAARIPVMSMEEFGRQSGPEKGIPETYGI